MTRIDVVEPASYVSVACVMPTTMKVVARSFLVLRVTLTEQRPLNEVEQVDDPPVLHAPLTVAPDTGAPPSVTTRVETVAVQLLPLVDVAVPLREPTCIDPTGVGVGVGVRVGLGVGVGVGVVVAVAVGVGVGMGVGVAVGVGVGLAVGSVDTMSWGFCADSRERRLRPSVGDGSLSRKLYVPFVVTRLVTSHSYQPALGTPPASKVAVLVGCGRVFQVRLPLVQVFTVGYTAGPSAEPSCT